MTSNDLRNLFLQFFEEKGHRLILSSSLVPDNDPTLLFTNAGMVQFKEVFLGTELTTFKRATTAQRCLRAGGKHNDLENVGYTARHHTFFEMLGNFSFGDYFKKEAIQFAWEFITQCLLIPTEKLWITVFETDEEAADIWLNKIKVDPLRFSRCGEKDNFWSMGETGPCGPCSEIFYDHGAEVEGGPPGSPNADGDRYVEIWNLVFMQYERTAAGEIIPLPKPSVDTGMGLERLTAVMQGVKNNYETDLFVPLIKAIAEKANCKDLKNFSMQVIADHIRAASFLVMDGVLPSNEGRGYVLRRIIRRAVRHGYKLGFSDPFFYELAKPLVKKMGVAYPQLETSETFIAQILFTEEQQFARTLTQGLKILESALTQLNSSLKIIPGTTIFRLYDTYGFPVDLTADIARERGWSLDLDGFEKEMNKQREKSQMHSNFMNNYQEKRNFDFNTLFTGYNHEQLSQEAIVQLLLKNGEETRELKRGEAGSIILNQTPFYAEGGGQVGDQGLLHHTGAEFKVNSTYKEGLTYFHVGEVLVGSFVQGQEIIASVDLKKRTATAKNHSATHLLNAALRHFLGPTVQQKGSLVNSDRLRFDFTSSLPLTTETLQQIEGWINEKIQTNSIVETDLMTIESARNTGAVALFDEKYSDEVRVLTMGDFSKELCGGTHVNRTGDIGLFKIIAESNIASGIRRIEAVTGMAALRAFQEIEGRLTNIAQHFKTNPEGINEKLKQEKDKLQAIEKRATELQTLLLHRIAEELLIKKEQIGLISIVVQEVQGVKKESLRNLMDLLKNKLPHGVIVIIAIQEARIELLVGVTKNMIAQVNAAELIAVLAPLIGGKGGGRADYAQAAGEKVLEVNKVIIFAKEWLKNKLE